MRWDELFGDLEAQLEAAETAEAASEAADRTRREAARLRLLDRLRPAVGHDLRLQVRGAGQLSGRLVEVGAQWVLVAEQAGRQALVPLVAVLAVSGLGVQSVPPDQQDRVFDRLGLGSALRAIARDRLPVTATLVDGSTLTGTVDRVGADFLELTEHAVGEPRRRSQVTGTRAVPFEALAVLRST